MTNAEMFICKPSEIIKYDNILQVMLIVFFTYHLSLISEVVVKQENSFYVSLMCPANNLN